MNPAPRPQYWHYNVYPGYATHPRLGPCSFLLFVLLLLLLSCAEAALSHFTWRHYAAGSRSVTSSPDGATFRTDTAPPHTSTHVFTIESPNPVPPAPGVPGVRAASTR